MWSNDSLSAHASISAPESIGTFHYLDFHELKFIILVIFFPFTSLFSPQLLRSSTSFRFSVGPIMDVKSEGHANACTLKICPQVWTFEPALNLHRTR